MILLGMIGANANSINAQCTCKSLGLSKEKGGRVHFLGEIQLELHLGDGPRLLGESLIAGSCKWHDI